MTAHKRLLRRGRCLQVTYPDESKYLFRPRKGDFSKVDENVIRLRTDVSTLFLSFIILHLSISPESLFVPPFERSIHQNDIQSVPVLTDYVMKTAFQVLLGTQSAWTEPGDVTLTAVLLSELKNYSPVSRSTPTLASSTQSRDDAPIPLYSSPRSSKVASVVIAIFPVNRIGGVQNTIIGNPRDGF